MRPLLHILAGLLLLAAPALGGQEVRTPVWAGKFYPAGESALRQTLVELSRQAVAAWDCRQPSGRLRALILPHAGYHYSGVVAACGVQSLTAGRFDKVLLMGPDHRVGFSGGAISAVAAYTTPLGQVPLHGDARRLLQQHDLFHTNAASDGVEHSLEVVLPFLQSRLGAFELVPIVLGPCDHRGTTAALLPLVTDRTLVVVSADLSHYLPYDQAVARDKATCTAIVGLSEAELLSTENRTCGKHPVIVLLKMARRLKWQARLLAYANSGDVTGDRRAVVGYAAIAFFGEVPMTSLQETIAPDQGQALVRLARKTLMERFGRKMAADQERRLSAALQAPLLQAQCGVFVTLTLDGRLRGCIGSLCGHQPLVEGVRSHSIHAAFNDPRFSPLSAKELDRVVIEVSVLTEPQPLDYTDADDLIAKLRPHVDGVTLCQGHASATFLPQVWEQLPRPQDFLSQLCSKAGLERHAWLNAHLEVETYQVQCFEELR